MRKEIKDINAFIEEAVKDIKEVSSGLPILCGLSGGVDSSVCAVLAQKAVGNLLSCVFVDTGFMRHNEGEKVEEMFTKTYPANFIYVDAKERFLKKLKGVTCPNKKRKIIGAEFVKVFSEKAKALGEIGFMLQGTIYSDVVESGKEGHGEVKPHHNVGGMPKKINFKGVIEPIKYLYKQEVREVAKALGLPESFANRQPFPGPGLAVRCLGELTKQRLDILRLCDNIFCTELESVGLQSKAKQYFAVLPNIKSVGVKDGKRTYQEAVALRAISSTDFVCADIVELPYSLLQKVSKRITAEVEGINRVLFDITGKPPSTIEYE